MFRHSSTCGMAVRGRPQCAVRQCTARHTRCLAPHRLGRNAAVAVRAQATAQQTPTVAPVTAVPAAPADAAPEAVASVQQPYMQYPQQGMAPRPEYYVAQPPALPMYPTPPVYAKQETSSPIPWWVWMAAGILVANVARMVQEFMKKGPQQFMAEMAMKQMMKGMTPPGAPGASPFGAPGGTNPFAAAAGGASPFGPYGAANPFAPNFQPPTAPVDTTATPVGATPAAAAAAAAPTSSSPDGGRGEKFASRKGTTSGGSTATTAAPKETASSNGTAAAAAGAASVAAGAAAAAPAMDVVEPEVKEPQGKKAASFFQDAAGDASSSGSSGSGDDAGQMASMMESMLRDPNLQKMLYPYLPEPMRNPDSIEWMLKTPEVRKQMETMFAQSNMSMNPQMLNMMKQMDFSQEKVQEQFSQLGLKPEDVMSKVMSTPDLAAGFANPKVQQAIFDISQNPMNITKYQNDPEVMNVLNKVTEVFSPSAMGGPSQ